MNVEMDILSILQSKRTIEVLKELKMGSNKSEVKAKLKLSNSTLLQILSKLSSLELISGEEITTKGELVLTCCNVVERYFEFLEKMDNINEYCIEDIPRKFLKRLYELSEIRVVERKNDTFRPHLEFMEAILNAKEIYGYSTIFFPEYVNTFLNLARKGVKIELCVNRKTFEHIISNYFKELLEGISYTNVKFYVSKKDFRFSMVVTDSYFSISFYFLNGFFDYRRDFVCLSEDGLRWGKDLFNYVKGESIRVDEDYIKRAKQ